MVEIAAGEVWCENCRTFAPLLVGPAGSVGLNEHPARDLVCGLCGWVAATIRHPQEDAARPAA